MGAGDLVRKLFHSQGEKIWCLGLGRWEKNLEGEPAEFAGSGMWGVRLSRFLA